jgi:hypothetical protein
MNAGYHGAVNAGFSAGRAVQAKRRPELSDLAADGATNFTGWTPRQEETGAWSAEPCATLSVASADAITIAPAASRNIRIDLLFIVSSLGTSLSSSGILRKPRVSSPEIQPCRVTNVTLPTL